METTSATCTPDVTHLEATTWCVDQAASSARFQAATLWGRTSVRGEVGQIDGFLEWSGSSGRGQMSIAAGGISSGNRLRDHHLRGGGFFDVARHPEVTFDAAEVVTDGSGIWLHGELEVRGRRHPFSTSATVRRLGDDRTVLEAHATLDLDELGMSRGFLRMLPAAVTADVRVVLQRVAG
jgi:polyisoprenoid-binding protein YceI